MTQRSDQGIAPYATCHVVSARHEIPKTQYRPTDFSCTERRRAGTKRRVSSPPPRAGRRSRRSALSAGGEILRLRFASFRMTQRSDQGIASCATCPAVSARHEIPETQHRPNDFSCTVRRTAGAKRLRNCSIRSIPYKLPCVRGLGSVSEAD